MAQSNFAAEVRNLLKGDHAEPETIWKGLSSENNAQANSSYFCTQIVEHLCNQKTRKVLADKQQQLYAMLLLIQFYKKPQGKPAQTLELCRKLLETKMPSPMKWALSSFCNPKERSSFGLNFISCLVYSPKVIDWQSDIAFQLERQRFENDKYLNSMEENAMSVANIAEKVKKNSYSQWICPETTVLSPTYVCFLDLMASSNHSLSSAEYQHTASILRALVNYTREKLDGLPYVCLFLHFIRNCVTYYGCPYDDVLQELLMLCNYLGSFSSMVAEPASALFRLLDRQSKIPGSAFRKRLRADYPALDIKDAVGLNKVVYLVGEIDECFSCREEISMTNLRKLMILQQLKSYDLEEEQYDTYHESLKQMPVLITYEYYFKMLKTMDICANLEVFDKIKGLLRTNMLMLFKTMHMKWMETKRKTAKKEIEQFEFWEEQGKLRYPYYGIEQIKLSEFVDSNAKFSFEYLLKQRKSQRLLMNFYRNSLQIVFYGNSIEFNTFVNSIVRFLGEADITEQKLFQVYYLPKPDPEARPEIGYFLAARDMWYRRFVYNIFNNSVLAPQLDIKSSNKLYMPMDLFNKTLHMYLREAKRIMPLRVYKCKIREMGSSQASVLYFYSYLMLGIFTEAEIIRINKLKSKDKHDKYRSLDVVEIIREKIKKFTPVHVDMDIEYIEPVTQDIKKERHKGIKFDDLQLCNLHKKYFMGGSPNPMGDGLKMAIMAEGNYKFFIKELLFADNFKQDKKYQEICLAFKDIFVSYTIKSLQVKTLDSPLKIIIDGRNYDNIESIEIETPISINGMPLTVPIYTFLPFV